MALDWKKTSKWWYGRFRHNGKSVLINLDVEIRGRRPASITGSSDAAFERSRERAAVRHDEVLAELNRKGNLEELTQRIVESKVGERVSYVPTSALADHWEALPRERTLSARYLRQCRSSLDRFVAFALERWPQATELISMGPEVPREFLKREAERGLSPKSWNDLLKLLRSAFAKLQPESLAYTKYLKDARGKPVETVHRRPFTVDELQSILRVCEGDELMRPLIVTGICTAMRKGDCCRLRWADVDLEHGFLSVRTNKTGARVEIPLFPAMRAELERTVAQRDGSAAFVFPELEAMYRSNPDGITYRVKKILSEALDKPREGSNTESLVSDRFERARAAIPSLANAARGEQARRIIDRLEAGDTCRSAAKGIGVSAGTVSNRIRELEEHSGVPLIARPNSRAAESASDRKASSLSRIRQPSVRDFHSFRVTWVTLALSSGIPVEIVQKVTGHKTAEIVMKHYFHPDREVLERAIVDRMPRLLLDPTHVVARGFASGPLKSPNLAIRVDSDSNGPEHVEERIFLEVFSDLLEARQPGLRFPESASSSHRSPAELLKSVLSSGAMGSASNRASLRTEFRNELKSEGYRVLEREALIRLLNDAIVLIND